MNREELERSLNKSDRQLFINDLIQVLDYRKWKHKRYTRESRCLIVITTMVPEDQDR
jgi:hypothetical protein